MNRFEVEDLFELLLLLDKLHYQIEADYKNRGNDASIDEAVEYELNIAQVIGAKDVVIKEMSKLGYKVSGGKDEQV